MALEVEIYGRNLEISDRLHDYVEKKVSKLDRFLKNIEEARVDLAFVKSARSANDRQIAQITIQGRGFILRVEERADDIFTAIDAASSKMQRRISRYKGKRFKGRGDGQTVSEYFEETSFSEEEDEAIPTIVRKKHFMLHPMDEQEAIEQMDLLGHEDFFVFYNSNTNGVNILYKRRDGDLGLIETEIA